MKSFFKINNYYANSLVHSVYSDKPLLSNKFYDIYGSSSNLKFVDLDFYTLTESEPAINIVKLISKQLKNYQFDILRKLHQLQITIKGKVSKNIDKSWVEATLLTQSNKLKEIGEEQPKLKNKQS